MRITAVDRPDAPPIDLPDRFRMEIVYFMTPPGERGAPPQLLDNDYWIDQDDARRWLD